MTLEEFEQGYAERSGVPLETLLKQMVPLPCDCGEDGCEGWQMTTISGVQVELEHEAITSRLAGRGWMSDPFWRGRAEAAVKTHQTP